jgi:hypothetical protein
VTERRHRSGGSRLRKALPWAGWIALFAALAGNVVWSRLHEENGRSAGFLTPRILSIVGLWAPIAAALLLSLCGLFWSSKAYAHSERSSLLWARRGFVFTLVGTVLFAFFCVDGETVDGKVVATLPREWLAVLASFVIGGQTALFAMLSFREYRRAEAGGGRRGRRPDADEATPSAPASTERPGAGG